MNKQEFIKKTSREIFDIFTNREKKETVVQVLDKNLNKLLKEAQREVCNYALTSETLTAEEIAHKYVHGIHDALTDSQEKKDMAEDIKALIKKAQKEAFDLSRDIALDAVMNYANYLVKAMHDPIEESIPCGIWFENYWEEFNK